MVYARDVITGLNIRETPYKAESMLDQLPIKV